MVIILGLLSFCCLDNFQIYKFSFTDKQNFNSTFLRNSFFGLVNRQHEYGQHGCKKFEYCLSIHSVEILEKKLNYLNANCFSSLLGLW